MEGIIIVNKPSGITSFDVIRKLRRILNTRRIGHTGTLDPMATGVMVVCVGRATRLAQDIEADFKVYEASLKLGIKTDTYDITGNITNENNNFNISHEIFLEKLLSFKGRIEQVPPMFSAIKINGEKLYNLARKGIEVERKSREVEIEEISLIDFDGLEAKINCKVSKGTYIRTLIDDLGISLGTYAIMTALKRTAVGRANIDESFTLEEIESLAENENFKFIKTVENYFNYDKTEIIDEKSKKLFLNGNTLKVKLGDGIFRVYYSDEFMGLASVKKGLLKGYKYF